MVSRPPRPGHALFARQVKRFGGVSKAAQALGVSRVYVHLIGHGKRVPGLDVARRIELLLKVPMRSWAA
jgi:hypothetical protein